MAAQHAVDPQTLLNKIGKTNPKDEEELLALVKTLRYHEANLARDPRMVAALLGQCQLPQHATAVTFLLAFQADSRQADADRLVQMATVLFTNCTELQMRHVRREGSAIVRRFADELTGAGQAGAAVPLLLRAVGLLSGNAPDTLTAAHGKLLQAALAAGHLAVAHKLASARVYHTASPEDGLHYSDVLSYFYYAGSTLCAYGEWGPAAAALRVALSFPAHALSAIAVEAYKKYICASLLATGELASLPKFAPSAVTRHAPALTEAYAALATAFKGLADQELGEVLTKHAAAFRRDRNLGLVQQVVRSARRRRVLKLTNTFVTLSLTDIGARAELGNAAAAEKELLAMVADGQLDAAIDQRVGMVTFASAAGSYDSAAEVAALTAQIATATEVAGHFAAVGRAVELTDDFLEKRVHAQARAAGQSIEEGGGKSGDGDDGGAAGDSGFAGLAAGLRGVFGQ